MCGLMDDMVSFLDQLIQKETSKPRLRENIQRCKDFVREYGWPEEDYYILVVQGEVKVLTEEKSFALHGLSANPDAFLLVSSNKPLSASPAEATNY
ncbi:hypothetical protein diail_11647 [Diaporthe ilicicola]|nr:hypothetical protein diail_11647 [Diaporthe ilicicola]